MKDSVELWKSHPNIDGIEVSSFGRVRSEKGHYYKICHNSSGYLYVGFRINGKYFNKRVHRLVAQTFLPNPDNLPQVNHKDCNTKNNNVENLEWCTPKYNCQYREKYGVSRVEAAGTPILAINLSTLEVLHFRSQSEASRSLGISQGNICYVIKGRLKYAGGYWFVNDDGHAVDVVKSKLHDVGGTGLKIKHRSTSKMH